MKTNFRVLGAGVWGLAFSDYLLNLGHTVEIFRRDTSLEDKSIQQLGLKNVSSNHIIALETLNDHKNNDAKQQGNYTKEGKLLVGHICK